MFFYTYEHLKFHAQLIEDEKSFITSGPGVTINLTRLTYSRHMAHSPERDSTLLLEGGWNEFGRSDVLEYSRQSYID